MNRLFIILGCTASGKGTVGRILARRIGGQIISVDSMKVYRRMDIGTAKPSPEERGGVPHHCIDIVEPSDNFSVAQYVEHADRAVETIAAAGAIPLAVGGTSLYIKALTEGLFDAPQADEEFRRQLHHRADELGEQSLHDDLAAIDPDSAERIHPNDRKRLVRALEVFHQTGQPISELQNQWDTGRRRYDCTLIGLRRDKAELHHRINIRVKRMIDAGLRDEVAALTAEPAGLAKQAAQAVGYAEMLAHLRGECTLEEAAEWIKINTRQLAKRQRTWHRRWLDVHWFDIPADEQPVATAERILADVKF